MTHLITSNDEPFRPFRINGKIFKIRHIIRNNSMNSIKLVSSINEYILSE